MVFLELGGLEQSFTSVELVELKRSVLVLRHAFSDYLLTICQNQDASIFSICSNEKLNRQFHEPLVDRSSPLTVLKLLAHAQHSFIRLGPRAMYTDGASAASQHKQPVCLERHVSEPGST